MAELGGALVLLVAGIVAFAGAAFALGSGDQVPGSAVPQGTYSAGHPFASGQVIAVKVPANSIFPPGAGINVVECASPVLSATSDAAALPLCDGLTHQGDTILANPDGSIDYTNFTLYALPDATSLGEPSNSTPVCNGSNSCVLYIGTDQTHPFSSAHFWSQTWWAVPTSGDVGTPAGDGSRPVVSGTSPTSSTVRASPASATADGSDASQVTVTLLSTGASPLPEPGKTVTLRQGSGHSTIAPPTATTNSSGQATFTVTDATAEAVTYAATDTTDTVAVDQQATVTFAAPVVTPAHCSVAASPGQVPADGSTTSKVTVTMRDQATNPVPVAGKTVALSQGGGHSTVTAVTSATDAAGQATFDVADSTTELVTYTATDVTDGIPITGKSATVTFGTISVSPSSSTVVAASSPAPTGGVGTTVTVTLLSSQGAPVDGKTVALAGSPSNSVTVGPTTTTDSQGRAVFQATDPRAETITFSATDATDHVALDHTATVAFEIPSPSATESTVDPPTGSAPANGSAATVILVTIKDQFGDLQPNKTVTAQLTDTSDNAVVVSPATGGGTPGVTNRQGQVTFEVRDTTAEVVTFTAVDKTDGFTLAATSRITFTPGSADAMRSTIGASPSNVPNDGHTASTVTVTVNDHFGNPVPGKAVTLAASGGSSVITPLVPTTDAAGQVTFAVTDTVAEIVDYAATDVTDQNLALAQSVAVTFGNPPPPLPATADSVVLATATTAPADGRTGITVVVILYDADGLPVVGKSVSLNPSGGQSVVTTTQGTTDSSGQAKFLVTDRSAETVGYSATDSTDGRPITGQSVSITFTPLSSTPGSGGAGSSGAGSGSTGGAGAGSGPVVPAVDSADSSAAGGGDGGPSLAFTGTSAVTRWLFVLGALLLVTGVLGRRATAARLRRAGSP